MTFRPARSPRRIARRHDRPAHAVEPLERRTLLAAQLAPVADADVQRRTDDGTFAAANFGADPALRVSHDPDDTYESFLTFDISSLAGVGSAALQMTGGQTDVADGTNNVAVFALPTTTWVEGNGSHPLDGTAVGLNLDNNPVDELHWNNRPSNFGGSLDTVGVGAAQTYAWDVTDYVRQQKAAGATRVSLILRSVGGTGTSIFASHESSGGPVLAVADDAGAPTAFATSPDVTTAGGTSQTVTVTYSDAGGVDASTVGPGDITVSGSGGNLSVTAAHVTDANPNALVVAYTVTPRGGSWDGADNGTYTVAVAAGEVLDFGSNSATGGGTFTVAIPVDVAPPIAQAFTAQPITVAGGSTYTFTITYTDNVGVNAGSILAGGVTVSRAGGPTLQVTGVTKTGSDPSVNATYTVNAPGGSWSTSDNGQYTIRVMAGSVTDAAGNGILADSSTFQVAVPDVGAPAVAISPVADIATAGTTTATVTVTYSDASLVDGSSIDSGDVSVVRDGGSALAVTLVSKSPGGNAASIVAVYSVAAPGGFWNADDNGSYTVAVAAGAVHDTSNNPSGLAGASFEVNIASTTAVLDPAFNGGSPISTGFVAEALAADATGRILVAGRQGDRAAGTSQSVLQRLNADGTLDTFFGAGGQIISFPNDNDGFFAVAVDEKQRIVAAGFRGNELQVVRYDAKGRLDKKFGQGGIVLADWGATDDTVYAVVALAGGAVVVGGTSGGSFAFAKFDGRGRTDTGFGSNGARLIKPGTTDCAVGAMSARADGSIVAAGTQGNDAAVLKLDAAGNPDAGFGTAGVRTVAGLGVRADLGRQDYTVGLAVDPDGKILVGNRTDGGDFAVYRLNADGSTDAAFDGDGFDTVDFGGNDDVDFLGLQGTGQIVVAGTTDAGAGGGPRRLAVAVLGPDGGLDSSFSGGGKFTDEAAVVADGGTTGALVLHANGMMQTDGRLMLSLAEASAKPSSSPVRRLVPPGSGVLGSFGLVNGKTVKLSFVDADETKVSLSLKNGTGRALWDGNVLDLVLTGTSDATSLAIGGKGGNKRVTLRDLRADGGLKSVSGKTTDVVGTFAVNGNAAKLAVGSLSGTLAVAGQIASLAVAGDLAGAYVLSGVSLGSDGKVGGTGLAADGYAGGRIAKIAVSGRMSSTYVGAGVNPQAGGFGDGDDVAPDGPASEIVSVSVKRGVDDGTAFAAGAFGGSAKIPQKVLPTEDAHFHVLPA